MVPRFEADGSCQIGLYVHVQVSGAFRKQVWLEFQPLKRFPPMSLKGASQVVRVMTFTQLAAWTALDTGHEAPA